MWIPTCIELGYTRFVFASTFIDVWNYIYIYIQKHTCICACLALGGVFAWRLIAI